MAVSTTPSTILLFSDASAFAFALSFCQDNNFDVTDCSVFDFNIIVVFEEIDVAHQIAVAVHSQFAQPAIYMLL